MKTYKQLLQDFPPRTITDETELEEVLDVIEKFREKEEVLSNDELEYIELLILLTEDYYKTDGKLNSFNYNYYWENDMYTPEEQITLMYEAIEELDDDIELILSFGQDSLIYPLSHTPDLDINFMRIDEDFLNVNFNNYIEESVKDYFEKVKKELESRKAKTVVLFAYSYPKARFKGYVNDVGIEVSFR